MAEKNCSSEFATEKQKMKNLEKVIFGNGQNGLVKKVGKISDELILQKERNSIKMWIYRTAIGTLIAVTFFILGYKTYIIK